MNLEQLASMLEKDAAELEVTLKLQKTDEVPAEVIQKEVKSSLKLAAITGISEGKKQAEGRAKKETLTEVERALKSKFEVDGNNFDELLEALSGKVGKVEYKADEKVIKERDIFKAKYEAERLKNEETLKKFEKIETHGKVKSKLEPILGKFEFATDRVKEIAINSFLESSEFLISGNEIFLVQDGKPVTSFDQFAEKHMSEFGKAKQEGKVIPKINGLPGNTSYGNNPKELIESLRKATTAEEKAAIQELLKKFD